MQEANSLTLEEMIKQREQMDAAIKQRQEAEREAGLKQIVEIMQRLDLTPADVANVTRGNKPSKRPQAPPRSTKGAKIPPKYRDAESGNQWTGRGLMPQWLKQKIEEGKSLEDFLIQA